MKYSTQAFLFRNKIPKRYDPFMVIATEKFSHLVMVGSSITMLLDGDENVEMTNDRCDWTPAGASLHGCMNPQYLALNGGTPDAKSHLSTNSGLPQLD